MILSRAMLTAVMVSITIPIFAVTMRAEKENDMQKEVVEYQIEEPDEQSDLQRQDITVYIVFADESETEPFAGHNTTLEQWEDLPEWNIPDEYIRTGGCLPESVRTYLFNQCTEHSISYPFMLALIEAESGYRWDAESPDGSCKGYTMINDKWHTERMERLGVSDIYNPYGNIAVSVDFIHELFEKYQEPDTVLMCYNCGEARAMELIADGITSTEYSRKILKREAEISLEMYGK